MHAHAAFPPSYSGRDLPEPIHRDETGTTWAIGAVPGAIDVETIALHEIGHIRGRGHSSVAGTVMATGTAPNLTERMLADDDIAGGHQLYSLHRLAAGSYTVRQLGSNRFLDAHETPDRDFSVVTRTAQRLAAMIVAEHAVVLAATRRTLDVGEQERHRSRRRHPHNTKA